VDKVRKKRQGDGRTAGHKGEAVNALNGLTKTEIRILAAARGGASLLEICDKVEGSPAYIRNTLAKLVSDGLMRRTPARFEALITVNVGVADVRND
jgi:DNA-binding CsgD family transcriptional regulator